MSRRHRSRQTTVVDVLATADVRVAEAPERSLPSTPTQLQRFGFPYDTPSEFTEEEGREVEAILAEGPPAWVRDLRKRLGR